MFLRPCYRRKNGKRHAHWALMESYRTEGGPRQRVVAYLGQLDERGRLGVKEAAEGRRRSRERVAAERPGEGLLPGHRDLASTTVLGIV